MAPCTKIASGFIAIAWVSAMKGPDLEFWKEIYYDANMRGSEVSARR